jgi:uracil-DNA glycosylase
MSYAIALSGADDLDGWLDAAARLAAANVPPALVEWNVGDDAAGLFSTAPSPLPEIEPQAIPEAFRDLVRLAICHRDRERFGLLYRLLFRLKSTPGHIPSRKTSPATGTR